MKRNIVEEIIYNSADVSPDFSCIEKRLNLPTNTRKTRHAPVLKRVLALFLGVLVISGAVFGIAKLAEDSTPSTHQGVVEDPIKSKIFQFEIVAPEEKVAYGETAEVRLKLQFDNKRASVAYFLPGDLTVCLEADEGIEIVSQSVYTIEDYDPHDSDSKYYYRDGYVMEFDFKVKFYRSDDYLSFLRFRVGFDTPDDVEKYTNSWSYGDYLDPYGDYVFCYSVAAACGTDGVLLTADTVYGTQRAYYDRIRTLVKVLDEEYKNGRITAEKYANLCRSYYDGDISRPIVLSTSIDGIGDYVSYDCLMYISPDLCVEMLISNEYRMDTPYDLGFEDEGETINSAKTLLLALRDSGAITQAEYDAAISDVDESGVTYADRKKHGVCFVYSNFTSTSEIPEICQSSFTKTFNRRYIYRNDVWTAYSGGENAENYSIRVEYGEKVQDYTGALQYSVIVNTGELGKVINGESSACISVEYFADGVKYTYAYTEEHPYPGFFKDGRAIHWELGKQIDGSSEIIKAELHVMRCGDKLFLSDVSWDEVDHMYLEYLSENYPEEYERVIVGRKTDRISKIVEDIIILDVFLRVIGILIYVVCRLKKSHKSVRRFSLNEKNI